MRFWRIGAGEPAVYPPDDLTGEGARRAGARWNPKGTPAVYASYHLATAALETLVHTGRHPQPANRYVVAVDVDVEMLDAQIVELALEDLPDSWDFNPPHPVSQVFGAGQFKLGHIGFAVPSIILHEELNLVLNPLHGIFKRAVRAQVTRRFAFDPRL